VCKCSCCFLLVPQAPCSHCFLGHDDKKKLENYHYFFEDRKKAKERLDRLGFKKWAKDIVVDSELDKFEKTLAQEDDTIESANISNEKRKVDVSSLDHFEGLCMSCYEHFYSIEKKYEESGNFLFFVF